MNVHACVRGTCVRVCVCVGACGPALCLLFWFRIIGHALVHARGVTVAILFFEC